MTTTRFVTDPGSSTGAVNVIADMAVQTAQTTVATSTTGAIAPTATQFVNGLLLVTGTPGAQTLTTPTAALIIAQIKNAQVGSSFDYTVMNNGDNTVTVAAGDASVTLSGTTTVAQQKTRFYKGVMTSTTALTLYGVGYGVAP